MICKPWSKEEFKILKNNYGKVKIQELEKLLPNRTRQAIQKYAEKNGIKGNYSIAQRKYTFKENFFDDPNIENCYWAGLLAADGCIGKDGCVIIALSEKDSNLICKFVDSVNFTGPIEKTEVKNHKYQRINIWGAHNWCDKLNKHWNITKRKSLTLQPPNLTQADHIKSFIIGYFDGDGCAQYNHNNKRYSWSVCGSESMIRWIREFIYSNILEENGKNLVFKHPKANCYYYTISGKKAYKVKEYFTNANTPYRLERKWLIG